MLKKYMLLILLSLTSCLFIVSCSNEEDSTTNNNIDETQEDVQQDDSEKELKEMGDVEKDMKESDNDADLADEDQYIGGAVTVNEDENLVRVELETNLVEGTVAKVNMGKAFGELSSPIGKAGSEKGEIESDGTVTIDY